MDLGSGCILVQVDGVGLVIIMEGQSGRKYRIMPKRRKKLDNMKNNKLVFSAAEIKKLLFEKHSKDLCVAECKTGPTWGNLCCKRMDFWAMKRSWAHPNMYGYEIKVNRGDFVNDQKWRYYLNYCTNFYFVCPPGLIDKEELPPEAGLLVTSLNCKRLYTKKHAPTRDIKIPEELYRYILMCRAVIKESEYVDNTSKYEFWKKVLEQNEEERMVGRAVSKKIREIIKKRIDDVELENYKLIQKINNLEQVKQFLLSIGFKENEIRGEFSWSVKPRLERFAKQVPDTLPSDIQKAIGQLENINKEFREILKFFSNEKKGVKNGNYVCTVPKNDII